MRKQTKIVAVASAAALLAIGASMTAFAAYGWVQDGDGTWYYYDKDGNTVEDEWKRSGDNWYWLSSEESGAMAIDTLVEDGDDTYYVDSNGVMVRNTWVKVVNEDQDDEDDPAEYNYYYMQSNGKAYKAPDSGNTKFRTIDGKRYAFDGDGKMLYGWVNDSNERITGDTGWSEPNGTDDKAYYCGNWDDGAMKTGWQKIYVTMPDDEEEEEHWFYFKSNGVRYQKTDSTTTSSILERTINGKKYGFDEYGVMVYEWTVTATTGNTASASSWHYFNSPEDGARVTKGWFKVLAPLKENDNTFADYSDYQGGGTFAKTDADDETERWYYADGKGEIYEGIVKRINGKYYGFHPEEGDLTNKGGKADDDKGGAMLTGLVLMKVDKSGNIEYIVDDDVDADELDDIINDTGDYLGANSVANKYPGASLYYFGSPENEDIDGAMKTGNVTINLDGSTFNFKFSKSGGGESKGRGLSEVDGEKYIYKYGCRIKASSDDKYKVVEIIENEDGTVNVLPHGDSWLAALRASADEADPIDPAKDYDETDYVDASGLRDHYSTYTPAKYFLVNTSGGIVKDKTAAKDGAEWYFYVKDGEKGYGIRMYTSGKKLNNLMKSDGSEDSLSKWNATGKVFTGWGAKPAKQ